eukprot:3456931-Amphidinium_carterae.1
MCNDPGHVDELQGIFGLEAGSKGAVTLGEKLSDEPGDAGNLNDAQTGDYRRAMDNLMWLSHERLTL